MKDKMTAWTPTNFASERAMGRRAGNWQGAAAGGREGAGGPGDQCGGATDHRPLNGPAERERERERDSKAKSDEKTRRITS